MWDLVVVEEPLKMMEKTHLNERFLGRDNETQEKDTTLAGV